MTKVFGGFLRSLYCIITGTAKIGKKRRKEGRKGGSSGRGHRRVLDNHQTTQTTPSSSLLSHRSSRTPSLCLLSINTLRHVAPKITLHDPRVNSSSPVAPDVPRSSCLSLPHPRALFSSLRKTQSLLSLRAFFLPSSHPHVYPLPRFLP